MPLSSPVCARSSARFNALESEVESSMRCPRCEADNREGRRFCAACGASLVLTCPACEFSNEPGENFCGGCGLQLAPPHGIPKPAFGSPQSYTPPHLAERILTVQHALEGERKQVTVLFADMKSSMELLAGRDPEEARKLLDSIIKRMMEAVHRYEGTVNQVLGDGIMSLFGAPIAHEDHAVRAGYAALKMQEAIAAYAEQFQQQYGVSLQIRVGLNAGRGGRARHRQRSRHGLYRDRPDDSSRGSHGTARLPRDDPGDCGVRSLGRRLLAFQAPGAHANQGPARPCGGLRAGRRRGGPRCAYRPLQGVD